jgi:D-arabinono-1,4-lactone oxidase
MAVVGGNSIPAEADGFRHPSSEAELIALVTAAAREGRQLRVRGSAHSPSHAVYTDPAGDEPNRVEQQAPPAGGNFNVMLDRYRGWRVRDEERKLVEADAGIHLGADPGPRRSRRACFTASFTTRAGPCPVWAGSAIRP